MSKKYCPTCNYAIDEEVFNSAKFDYPCPNCNISKLSTFYSNGSFVHHQILNGEHWQTSFVSRSIPPLHAEVKHEQRSNYDRRRN